MIRSRIVFAVFLVLSLLTARAALPGEEQANRLTVVELFTSQGCSSCPPADRFLGKLADEPGILALTWNVDYWDYLGWSDTFARREHTRRQKAYNRAMGKSGLYTPQMIIDGRHETVGSREDTVRALITERRGKVPDCLIRIERTEENLNARLIAGDPGAPLVILMIVFDERRKVAIRGGELKDRAMTYRNVVRNFDRLATWENFADPIRIRIDGNRDKDMAGTRRAILFQKGNGGPIAAAYLVDELN